MLKTYADNLVRFKSDSSRSITGRGGTPATQIATTATNSTTIRTITPKSRQSVSRTSDADNGSTRSEVGISHLRICRSQGGSSSKEEGGKYGAHATRPSPTATPIAEPGRQTGSSVTPTPAISFGGPIAEEKSNLCYMFGMTDNEEPVKKALLALSSAANTS